VINTLIKRGGRELFNFWGKVGKAPGYRYQAIDRWGHLLHEVGLRKRLKHQIWMDCDLRDHVQRQLYFYGAYEPIDAYLFCSMLKPGMTVVDAGANVGFYSLMAAKAVGANGTVHSFEPVPSNFDKLRHHINTNKLADVIIPVDKALWETRDTLHLSRSMEQDGNLGTYTAANREKRLDDFVCTAITLDEYVTTNKISRVDAIKMDIEGAELFALRGARETLTKYKPLLMLEIQPATCKMFGYQPADLWNLLRDIGYQMWIPGLNAADSKHLENLDGIEDNVFFYAKSLQLTSDQKLDL
jgi:FkbM family methyltransferase